ncbi:DUF2493 domain-containing protein [Sinorhizobium sojae]|uniref:DUF2493 domain-containing protein n=1 Tax=Sinorhizobium sojae TaxID=716925 RepID=UPI000551AAE1
MRVLVCGGRDYCDYETIKRVLDDLHAEHPIEAVIHGNSRGADRLSGVWAKLRNVPCWPVPAQWAKYGKAAGPKRNQAMLGHRPALVVAFPGGNGTADMIRRAKAASIPVHEVQPLPSPPGASE